MKAKLSDLMTSKMVAEKLGYTPDYIRRLIMEGKLKATKLGHDWIITPKDIAHLKPKKIKEKELSK